MMYGWITRKLLLNKRDALRKGCEALHNKRELLRDRHEASKVLRNRHITAYVPGGMISE